jgi:uncharacterized Tic20 family protein
MDPYPPKEPYTASGAPYPEKQPLGAYPDVPYFPPESITSDDKSWAMLAHLSGLIAALLGGLTFLGPLIVYLIKKDSSPFVADQAKEALNFQLAALIVSVISVVTCIGPVIVLIGALVYAVIGAMEANKGIVYRYPYTFRLIT